MTDRTDARHDAGAEHEDDDNWQVDEGDKSGKGGRKTANGADDHEDDDAGEDDQGGDEVSVEDLAIELGWQPGGKGGKFKPGDKEYVGPEEFLRRIAKSQKGLTKKLEDREAEFAERLKRLEQANTASRRREIAEIKAYYDDLLEDAIESGDKKRIRAARDKRDQALDELEGAEEDPPQITDDQFVEHMVKNLPHPKIQKPFFRENAWLLDDEDEDGNEAFAEIEEIIQDVVNAATKGKRAPTHEEMERAFDAAQRHLKRAYAHRLQREEDEDLEDEDMDEGEERGRGRDRRGRAREEVEDRPRRRTPVLASGSRTRGRSLASRLPPEAVRAGTEFVEGKNGPKLYADLEEYAKVYFRERGEKV